MKGIQIFKHEMFGEIRTMTGDDGMPLFVGRDVAKALGYADTYGALKKHVDGEDKLNCQIDSPGQRRGAVLINESGLYSLVLSSKLPHARQFKRWVTSEVLPQIRRTGGYIPTRDAEGRKLSDEEIVEQSFLILGRTLQQLNADNEKCLTATEVARSWGMDVRSFNQMLLHMGIQHRRGGRWQLDESLEGQELAEVRHYLGFSLRGKPKMKNYLTWTQKGVDFLNHRLHNCGKGKQAIQLNIIFKDTI